MNIIYKPYILTNLTGNTTDYSGVTGITSGILISSGSTFNINDFYLNIITSIDIIDNIVNYIEDSTINKYMLDVLIVGNVYGETLIYTTINTPSEYCIKLSYNNEIENYLIVNVGTIPTTSTTSTTLTTSTTSTTSTTILTPTTTTTTTTEFYSIIYKNEVTNILTGNTATFSGSTTGITSDIYISSGITFNIFNFDEYSINRLDIINNTINYIDNLDKYMLDTLIVDINQIYISIEQVGEYCVKFSYNNNIEDYLIVNVISGNTTTTTTTRTISPQTTTTTTTIRTPTITYNYPISGTSWIGGENIVPYNAYLHINHDGLSGWTLNNLKMLFISGITDYYDGDIPLSAITFKLFMQGSHVLLNEIINSGIYDIFISAKNTIGNSTYANILNITANDISPQIVYYPYVLSLNLTGNTTSFTGATSGITNNIFISSGFTLNIGGFDSLTITKLDIIENVVNYINILTEPNANKYMLDILIVGNSHNSRDVIIYDIITKSGDYCIKISLIDKNGNETINYFMMKVLFDISIYSEGYWQDNKVWIDFTIWLDHQNPRWIL